jgi:hypothetical protein
MGGCNSDIDRWHSIAIACPFVSRSHPANMKRRVIKLTVLCLLLFFYRISRLARPHPATTEKSARSKTYGIATWSVFCRCGSCTGSCTGSCSEQLQLVRDKEKGTGSRSAGHAAWGGIQGLAKGGRGQSGEGEGPYA